ncbi:MAG: NapC/NirT family cytochrome c [Vitreoscilla sp.]|nr:NapC/NirT family cytochrome c [Burkholderiales bacterium]MBP6336691.1 NapC/NirT family cytochrome c [Vitreoscilla sp.]MBP6674621.1 NapC/NirT family cytochrome c [Vitreoscilla sp.]
MKKLLAWLRRPVAFGSTALLGAFAGVLFWGGFNTAMDRTNTLEFCTSCHEMGTVYAEYKQSVHYKNASGVRATCPDCHVPKDWMHKMARKVQASGEIYHKLVGTIDTPEKFEARRPVLAERVWQGMLANDSRECRNCHSFDSMDFHKQSDRAREKMETAAAEHKTCIECHKGIAHRKPAAAHDD